MSAARSTFCNINKYSSANRVRSGRKLDFVVAIVAAAAAASLFIASERASNLKHTRKQFKFDGSFEIGNEVLLAECPTAAGSLDRAITRNVRRASSAFVSGVCRRPPVKVHPLRRPNP
jgi:hypothetical protein